MAIVNPNASDQLDAALANGQQFFYTKNSGTLKGAGNFQSLWKANGLPLAGTTPVLPGAVPNRQTLGALSLNAFGASTGYLANYAVNSSTQGTLFLADRLYHCSGINSNIITLQTINGPNITRGVTRPNLLFIEQYGATPATASNLTINYTNLANVAKSIVTPLAVSGVANQFVQVPILDTGVLSIQSVTLSAAIGASIDIGLTIVNPIEMSTVNVSNLTSRLGVYDLALPVIDSDACLFFYWLASGTTASQINGKVSVAVG